MFKPGANRVPSTPLSHPATATASTLRRLHPSPRHCLYLRRLGARPRPNLRAVHRNESFIAVNRERGSVIQFYVLRSVRTLNQVNFLAGGKRGKGYCRKKLSHLAEFLTQIARRTKRSVHGKIGGGEDRRSLEISFADAGLQTCLIHQCVRFGLDKGDIRTFHVPKLSTGILLQIIKILPVVLLLSNLKIWPGSSTPRAHEKVRMTTVYRS